MIKNSVILEIIALLETGVMMCGVFCVPITKKKPSLACGLLLMIAMCAATTLIGRDNFIVDTVVVFISPVILMLWTEGKLLHRLAVYICSISYLGLPYLIIDILFSSILGKQMSVLTGYWWYHIVRGILTIAGMGVLTGGLWKIQGYQKIISGLPAKYFLIGSICTFAALLVQGSIEDIIMEYGSTRLANIVAVCTVMVILVFYISGIGIVVLDIFRKKYREESSMKDKYLQITKDYIKSVRDSAAETRKMRHDMQAHLSVLSYFMEQKEYYKAEEYLSEVQAHMKQMIRKMPSVGHEIVDAVLLQAQSASEEHQITWNIEGALPGKLPIEDFDLCTIFSNLLSNSIEGAAKVEAERRYIHLEIRQFKNHLLIELENPVEAPVDIEKLGHATSKEDSMNHGYGIANVMEAAGKANGEVSFENRAGKFAARVIFELEN